jgi:hypothetical protein
MTLTKIDLLSREWLLKAKKLLESGVAVGVVCANIPIGLSGDLMTISRNSLKSAFALAGIEFPKLPDGRKEKIVSSDLVLAVKDFRIKHIRLGYLKTTQRFIQDMLMSTLNEDILPAEGSDIPYYSNLMEIPSRRTMYKLFAQ